MVNLLETSTQAITVLGDGRRVQFDTRRAGVNRYESRSILVISPDHSAPSYSQQFPRIRKSRWQTDLLMGPDGDLAVADVDGPFWFILEERNANGAVDCAEVSDWDVLGRYSTRTPDGDSDPQFNPVETTPTQG